LRQAGLCTKTLNYPIPQKFEEENVVVFSLNVGNLRKVEGNYIGEVGYRGHG
jgi:hypothetical protein